MNIMKYLKNLDLIPLKLCRMNLLKLSDRTYVILEYKEKFGVKPNLKSPKTFNEKIQWLKLNDRKNIYTIMVDKYEVKKYVSNIIGENHIIPTLGIYESFEEINFEMLPKQFVMKTTHDSGGIIVCKNKDDLDIDEIRNKINKLLKSNYYKQHREWPYKNVRPRIIIEKYMCESNNKSLKDYKFFCFNGVPKLMYLSEGIINHSSARMNFYDMEFNLTDCKRKDYKQLEFIPQKPKTFEQMKEYAAMLSKGHPHLRVDFYEVNGHLFFGELTFYTCSGYIPFENEKWNYKLGNMIKLGDN